MPKNRSTTTNAPGSRAAIAKTGNRTPTDRRIDPRTPIPEIPPVPQPGNEPTGTNGRSVVTPGRRYYQKLTRYNPIRLLTPERLSTNMDNFKNGYLREFALMMEAVAARDDVLQSVIPKRKAAVKRLKWQIAVAEDLPPELEAQADAQRDALHYFYDNLTATSAVDANVKAGWNTFIDQMMNAIGHFYAVHEILWKPSPEGLTAEFNYVPLWFFENRTGKLRFLPHDFAVYGDELVDKGWLVTCGPGLLEPSCVAYMFKNMSLKDWALYCEKHGMPGVHGQTSAPFNSPQWQALEAAVADIAADFSCVTGQGDKIEKIDFSQTGELPYEPLVERMDRALSWMWRGGSMSTTGGSSKGPEQFGAGMQEDEETRICEDDCALMTETLNTQVDRVVIEWMFGVGTKPLAFVKIAPPRKLDVDRDIKVFEFMSKSGVDVGKNQLREHFNVPPPDPDDEVVKSPMEQMAEQMGGMGSPFGGGGSSRLGEGEGEPEDRFAQNTRHMANQRLSPEVDAKLLQAARTELAKDMDEALKPLRERIEGVLEMPNEKAMQAAVRKLRADLPALLREINRNPANADALYKAMTAGWFNGLLNGVAQRN